MAHEPVNTALLQQFSPLDGLKRDNLAALARYVRKRPQALTWRAEAVVTAAEGLAPLARPGAAC